MEGGEQSKGIPGFWFNVLNCVAQISDTIKVFLVISFKIYNKFVQEHDEPILKYLTDITSEVHSNPPGFTLNFYFAENPYFSNELLTKYYELNIDLDKDEPSVQFDFHFLFWLVFRFEYDGPTVVKSQGCSIDWNEGKNVTQKTVKKKQKRGPQAGKFVTKTVL